MVRKMPMGIKGSNKREETQLSLELSDKCLHPNNNINAVVTNKGQLVAVVKKLNTSVVNTPMTLAVVPESF